MTSLLQRFLPKFLKSAPAPVSAPAAAPVAVRAKAPVSAPSATPVPANPFPVTMPVRRPLIGAKGQVDGFEIRLPEATVQTLLREGDRVRVAAHVTALLVAARLVGMGGKVALARLPASWLLHAVLPKTEEGIVVALEAESAPDAATMQALTENASVYRSIGARLAWGSTLQLGLSPDFELLRERLEPGRHSRPVIVTDVATLDQLEQVLQAGARYACGTLVQRPAAQVDAVQLQPEARHVAQLLQQLTSGAETSVIVGGLKGDIALSVRLLQRINSASYAQTGGVASIDQAVALLGRNELRRWLSMMLVQFAGKRHTSSALQEVTLWRSRLIELLAIERGETEPGQFFTLGLGSMLGLLLSVSPADVVTMLCLPEPAQQALLEQTGPWYVYLRMVAAVDGQNLDDAMAAESGFGSAERVQTLSEQAWHWAAEHSDKAGASA